MLGALKPNHLSCLHTDLAVNMWEVQVAWLGKDNKFENADGFCSK